MSLKRYTKRKSYTKRKRGGLPWKGTGRDRVYKDIKSLGKDEYIRYIILLLYSLVAWGDLENDLKRDGDNLNLENLKNTIDMYINLSDDKKKAFINSFKDDYLIDFFIYMKTNHPDTKVYELLDEPGKSYINKYITNI